MYGLKGKKYDSKKSKFNKPFKQAMKPVKDNVHFPMESKNKIWSGDVPDRFKEKMKKAKKAKSAWDY